MCSGEMWKNYIMCQFDSNFTFMTAYRCNNLGVAESSAGFGCSLNCYNALEELGGLNSGLVVQ